MAGPPSPLLLRSREPPGATFLLLISKYGVKVRKCVPVVDFNGAIFTKNDVKTQQCQFCLPRTVRILVVINVGCMETSSKKVEDLFRN